jgi:hypothetical protein
LKEFLPDLIVLGTFNTSAAVSFPDLLFSCRSAFSARNVFFDALLFIPESFFKILFYPSPPGGGLTVGGLTASGNSLSGL